MQKIVFLLGFLLAFGLLRAQDVYVVQQVKGVVKAANKPIKPGDKLQSNTSLQFASNAMLLVSSQKYGATVLKPNPQAAKSEAAVLLNELLPQQMRASTKSGLVLCNASDFSAFFGSNIFRVYGEKAVIQVCELAYPLNSDRFFYVVYEVPGGDVLNIALNSGEKRFLMDMASMENFDHKALSVPTTLFYYNNLLEESSELGSFQLQFANSETKGNQFATFEKEAKAMVELLQSAKASKKEILQNLTQLGNQHFGPCGNDNLEEWLRETFGIE